jgi:hypothetical protein
MTPTVQSYNSTNNSDAACYVYYIKEERKTVRHDGFCFYIL